MLAYAMTLALPESYTTVKQNLWLRSPFTSAEIVGVVQAEWARRKTSHNSGALIAIQQQGSGKSREKGDCTVQTTMLIAPSIKHMDTTLQNVSAFTVDQAVLSGRCCHNDRSTFRLGCKRCPIRLRWVCVHCHQRFPCRFAICCRC